MYAQPQVRGRLKQLASSVEGEAVLFVQGEDAHVDLGLLKEFMEKHLLSLLGVLNVCNGLRAATSAIRNVQGWLTKVSCP